MNETNLNELREYLLEQIESQTNIMEIQKINRLIRLHELNAECDAVLAEDGVKIIVRNGSQEFIKSHPLMNDKVKINAQIIALEKSINFKEIPKKQEADDASLI